MNQGKSLMYRRAIAALSGVFAASLATSASADLDLQNHRFLTAPLQICDQGDFFIGGVPKVTNYATSSTPSASPAQITVGQMYVQFQRPMKSRKWPLIMVHGSTHSGACVQSTPHGTEGWAPYTVRHNITTYVVDQSGRGRSGNDESRVHEGKALLLAGDADCIAGNANCTATIPNIGRITDNGSWTAWFGHLVLPGTATTQGATILNGELQEHGWRPDDPNNTVMPPAVPIHAPGVNPQFGLPPDMDAISAFVDPGNLLLTNTGTWGDTSTLSPADRYKLHYYRQLLPNYESTLPGATCATCTPTTLPSTSVWTPRNLATLVEKLGGAVVATHSQSGIMGHQMTRYLHEDDLNGVNGCGGNTCLSMLKGLITIEGSCSLSNSGTGPGGVPGVPTELQEGPTLFDPSGAGVTIPYLAVKGDYTAHSNACQASVARINDNGGDAFYLELDNNNDPTYTGEFAGVTHMMMDDTANLAVMDAILEWTGEHIDNPPSATKCPQ